MKNKFTVENAAIPLIDHQVGTINLTKNIPYTPPILALVPAALLDKQAQARALKRRETADDLVGAFVFFASDNASFITGQMIQIDGGNDFI